MSTTNNTISFEIQVLGRSETIKNITEIERALGQVAEERKALTNAYKDGLISEQQYNQSLQDLTTKQKVFQREKRELNTELRQEQKLLSTTEGSMARMRVETAKLAKTVNNFAVGVDGTQEELDALKRQLAANRKAIIDFDQSLNDGRSNVGRYAQSLQGILGAFRQGGIGGGVSSAAAAFPLVGGVVALGVAAVGAYQALDQSIETFSEFQQKMKDVQAVSSASAEEMRRLEQLAKDLGATTQFTASQVADLQLAFARIGFKTDQIEAATAATLDLSIATGEDLAGSAEVVANTLGGYQLEATETQRVTDVMAASFNNSALNLERFRESTKLVAPVAQSANVSIETTTALLGALANAGISGTEAGTALRRIISELSNENSKASKAIGFSVKNSEDLVRAFQELSKQGVDNSRAIELVGRNAQSAFGVLVNSTPTIEELAVVMDNATGAAGRMADIVGDSLSQDMKAMRSAIEALQINFVELINGGLRGAVQGFTDFLGTINRFLAIPLSKKMEEDQVEMNALAGALIKTADETGKFNMENETTVALLDMLRAKFPDVVEGMNEGVITVESLNSGLQDLQGVSSENEAQLNDLAKQLIDTADETGVLNEKKEDTASLMGQINELQPGFIEGLNREKGTVDALKASLEGLNTQYVQKILLQRNEEKLQRVAEKQAKARENLVKLEIEAQKIEQEIEKRNASGQGSKVAVSFSKTDRVDVSDANEDKLKSLQATISVTKAQLEGLDEQFKGIFNERNLIETDEERAARIKQEEEAKAKQKKLEEEAKARADAAARATVNEKDKAEKDKEARKAKAKADKARREREKQLREEERFQNELLGLQQTLITEEIKLIEDGLEQQTQLAIARNQQEIEDLKSRKIVKEKLSEDELRFNALIDQQIVVKQKALKQELEQIETTYRERLDKEEMKAAKEQQREMERSVSYQIGQLNIYYDRELELLEKTVSSTKDLEEQKRQLAVDTTRKKIDLLKKEAAVSGTVSEDTVNQLRELQATLQTLTTGTEKKSFFQEQFGIKEEDEKLILETAQGLTNDLFNFAQERNRERVQKDLEEDMRYWEQRKERGMASLEQELNAGFITQQEYEQRKITLEMQTKLAQERAERKAFEQEKALNRRRVLMEQATGAIRAVVTSLGNPLAIALKLGAIAVQTGLSIAAINRQQYPKAKRGMFLKDGRTHNEGGELVEIEKGEVVLNQASMASDEVLSLKGTPLQIADALNRYKGGIPFLGEASQIALAEGVPIARLGLGVSPPAQPIGDAAPMASAGFAERQMAFMLSQMEALVNKVNDIKIAIPVRDITEQQAKMSNTKKAANWSG